MRGVFGDDELGTTTLALFQSALRPETYQNYGSALKGFFRYCEECGLTPVEATPVDVARYISWLAHKGTVAAGSLQPYLSAINRFLRDHNRPPVALGPLVSDVRRGLENCQVDISPSTERLPLPAPVALSILELAEGLVQVVHWDPSDQRLLLLRACVATLACYAFFSRGECAGLCQRQDLILNNEYITLRLRAEKGKKGRREGRRSTRQIACPSLPRLASLLRLYFAGVDRIGLFTRRWALSPAENKAKWSADTISVWLASAYAAAGHHPPEGFAWTSHSLRKGAASAAYAIKVDLPTIKYEGGWATTSTVLEAHYIDFAMRPTDAAWLFFGRLRMDVRCTRRPS